MERKIQDALVASTKALPAAAASANTDALRIDNVEAVDIEFGHEAVSALVDTKTLTLKVQDSANGVDGWNDIAALTSLVSTGASSAGAAAASRTVKLPPSAKAFIRVNAAVETGGGNNTGKNFFIKAKF
jgi:hypothetical protein